jgi:hypothetical protein
MTRSVAAYLHLSSSQPVYDDDRFQSVSSSVSEDESREKNGNGVIAKRQREAQGDCEVEIAGERGQRLGSVGGEALDRSAAVHDARLARGCDQPSAGDANDPAYECGKRKKAWLESSSSVEQPWVSSAEDTQARGGRGHGSSVKCMGVSAIDGPREDGGSSFGGNKAARRPVEPQANSSHVQPVSQTSADSRSAGQMPCMSCYVCFTRFLLSSYKLLALILSDWGLVLL